MPFSWEVHLFRICGVPVYAHVLLLAYFAYDLSNAEAAAKAQIAHGLVPNYTQAGFVALGCTLGFLVLFLTVLVHELGHCAGAKLVGGSVQRILLWPLGGLAFCGGGGGPGADLLVAVAGPLTHVPQYAAWWALHAVAVARSGSLGAFGPILVKVCAAAMSSQILLALFNLLVPVYPLDCSRIIMALLCLVGMTVRLVATIMCALSLACVGVLTASMFGLIHLPLLSIGLHPMNVLLVCWLGYQTYQLFKHISQNDVRHHPLFDKPPVTESQPLCRRTE